MSEVFDPAMLALRVPPAAFEVGWELNLNRNILMAKDTARTGNEAFFRTAQLLRFSSPIDWRKILLHHLPVDPGDASHTLKPVDLHKMNKDFILGVKVKIETIRPQVESEIQASTDQDAALAAVDKIFDDIQKSMHDDIEKTRLAVKAEILKYPTEQSRTAAVNVWQESWQVVQKAVATIIVALQDIVNAIAKFFQNVWQWVEKAWRTIEVAVQDVIDWFEGLF